MGKKGVCIDVKYVNNSRDWRLPALPERRDARERHGADDLLHVFHELSKPIALKNPPILGTGLPSRMAYGNSQSAVR